MAMQSKLGVLRGAVVVVAMALASQITAAAPAATATPPAAPSAVQPAANPNELVCKRVREVNSHIAKKVCKTRAQIDSERAAAGSAFERINSNPSSPGSRDGTSG